MVFRGVHKPSADCSTLTQWGSIESNSIAHRLVFLLSEHRFVQRDEPLLRVRPRAIGRFLGLQAAGVAATVAVSQTIAAIGFPVLIILLIPLRTHAMPRWFLLSELEVLDDFTCTNKQVLASLGGAPALPEHSREEDWGLERRRSEQRFGVHRQRAGSLKR